MVAHRWFPTRTPRLIRRPGRGGDDDGPTAGRTRNPYRAGANFGRRKERRPWPNHQRRSSAQARLGRVPINPAKARPLSPYSEHVRPAAQYVAMGPRRFVLQQTAPYSRTSSASANNVVGGHSEAERLCSFLIDYEREFAALRVAAGAFTCHSPSTTDGVSLVQRPVCQYPKITTTRSLWVSAGR